MSLVIFATKTFISISAIFQSIKALQNHNTEEMVAFWLVFGMFTVFEGFYLQALVPLYDYIKLLFLCWLLFSGGKGVFLQKVLVPHLTKIEQAIEDSDARNAIQNRLKIFTIAVIKKIKFLIE
ncbi:TB2/DP1 and transmembrane domain-containing protein [Spironucleus salmonicida]|uniref:TB2/DP1 and transmembrane domain-containing protein n=1 Tax=Spironucleus salmonicida TaxID=348837 RepID=V6LNY6_9EUKA|nr:TB2/DP1 and transmembrane domain-containing protein [Spironucleus salmonicida]|eukprot:EST45431.1 TB2/DP1 and transmembrane domain-containing protein [Spironucleus salmonicida]